MRPRRRRFDALPDRLVERRNAEVHGQVRDFGKRLEQVCIADDLRRLRDNARRVGELISVHVIPRPFEETEKILQHWSSHKDEQNPQNF